MTEYLIVTSSRSFAVYDDCIDCAEAQAKSMLSEDEEIMAIFPSNDTSNIVTFNKSLSALRCLRTADESSCSAEQVRKAYTVTINGAGNRPPYIKE